MNGRWPLVLLGVIVLAAAIVFGLNRQQANSDVAELKRVLGKSICRQYDQAVAFKATKDFPQSTIDRAIRNLQQDRADLGLKLCQRKETP